MHNDERIAQQQPWHFALQNIKCQSYCTSSFVCENKFQCFKTCTYNNPLFLSLVATLFETMKIQ